MATSSASLHALEVAPTLPVRRPRRHAPPGSLVEMDRHGTAILVTDRGEMRIAPLIAAMSRVLPPGSQTQLRRHAGSDLVCLVLGGVLRYEPVAGRAVTLWAESVAVLSTGAGVEYRWRSIGDEPAHMVMLWLVGEANGAPRMEVDVATRRQRLGRFASIAGRDTGLPTAGDVRVTAGVVPVGGSLVHAARGRRRYLMSTIGAISADGLEVAAGAGALIERRGTLRVSARQSTEVVLVETA